MFCQERGIALQLGMHCRIVKQLPHRVFAGRYLQGLLQALAGRGHGIAGILGIGPPIASMIEEFVQCLAGIEQTPAALKQRVHGPGELARLGVGQLTLQPLPGAGKQVRGGFHQIKARRYRGLERKPV